jgi:tetratricopeptide (TPR) repeat protein
MLAVLVSIITVILIYAFNQSSKHQNRRIINPLRRLQLQQELYRAKIAAKYIGKAHQYLILGNILLELGEFDRSQLAYTKSLNKDPKNLYALWGAALVASHQERWAIASRHLELLLKIDRRHLQGDASLLYAKVLFNLEKWSVARAHLNEDIYYWGHPEAIVMLAKIEIQDGNIGTAKKLLENMLLKIKGSPTYHSRRYQPVTREAASIIRTMPLVKFQRI